MRTECRSVFLFLGFLIVSGCAIDASSPIERIEPSGRYWYGPVTHEVVCRCTCRSDNDSGQNPETHALPASGTCAPLDGAQCELADSGAFGKLEYCFKKSMPAD